MDRPFLIRLLIALTGEGLQGGFHFVLNVCLIKLLTPADYGLFAIIFVIAGVSLSYVIALAAVPASVFIGRSRSVNNAHLHDVLFAAAAIVLSLGFSGATAFGLWLVGEDLRTASLSAAFVTLWSFRTYVRAGLLARRMAEGAALSDLCFAFTGGSLLLGVMFGDQSLGVAGAIAILAAANGAGLAVAAVVLRRPLRLSGRRTLRRRYRAHWPSLSWSFFGVTTATLQGQGQTLLVAAFIGPASYAPIAAAFVLFSPMRLAVSALISTRLADLAQALVRHDKAGLQQLVNEAAILIGTSFLLFGGALWLSWPLLQAHLFQQFATQPMGLIATLVWLVVAASQAYAVPRALLEAACRFRDVAIGTTLSAGIGLLSVGFLLATLQPAWSLLGVLAAEVMTLTFYLWKVSQFTGHARLTGS